MTSAGSSAAERARPVAQPRVLHGPVAVCVDRPLLSLDRTFTYDLPAELEAGVGSSVQVPFHGRATRGWVLGPAEDRDGTILRVRKAISPARLFDDRGLELLRWVSERYVAPLAAVIARAVPPRVASEEAGRVGAVGSDGRIAAGASIAAPSVLGTYRRGPDLLAAIDGLGGAFVLRPGPDHEQLVAVEAVASCLARGRRAIVIVPESNPTPATALAVLDAFGDRAVAFLGGDRRERYRAWLDIADGAFDVVVGTRPAVFTPLARVGLVYVARESHPAHREERAPYYHVRDVALARARLDSGVCVLSAICPSAETAAAELPVVEPPTRRWPAVEVVRPGPEGRAPRLLRALADARRGFLFSPLPGYGIASVCRACREPAACAACGGLLRASEGAVRCAVCGAAGRCRSCGSSSFGVRRGGIERVEEWAGRVASVRVRRLADGEPPHLPGEGEILVGGPDQVRDLGPGGLDVVGILDADLADRRPGIAARERSLAVWMEAVAWAHPRGRAIVQSSSPAARIVQAVVRGNPDRFHADEIRRRRDAGLPVGAAVFRITGRPPLADELRALDPTTLLVSADGDRTVCLVALDVGRVRSVGGRLRELAAEGVVERVEAEPHL